MNPWQKLLERPESHGHLVQLYHADESALTKNVGRYLWEGQKRGDGLLVIATPANEEAFRKELARQGADPKDLVNRGHLAFFDAQETLARFMVAGQPEWGLFANVVGAAMRQVRPRTAFAGLRAYGEMVGILWKARQYAAAIRLEQFWNKLLTRSSFSLFCGYAIDVFGKDFQVAALDALLSAHTHMLPATDGNLEIAIHRAMEEVLGPAARDLKLLIKANVRPSWAVMPFGEAMALWLRNNLSNRADEILDRARGYYAGIHFQTDRGVARGGQVSRTNMDTRVLLIHDDRPRDDLYRRMLGGETMMDIAVAQTAEEVQRQPVPELILLDLDLSRPSSLEILEWLRSERPYVRIPVIGLTSPRTAHRVGRAYELGVNSCVMKSEEGGLQEEVARGIGSYAKVLKASVQTA